jgi:trk system potassium uptake protein TrkH
MYYRIVLRILGLLLIFLGGAMLLPLPFSFYYGDGDYVALLISSGISLTFGMLAFLQSPKKRDLRPKEGFAVVTLGWITFSLFGSLPYMLSGTIPSFTDAFFETMSGFSTTGATILTDIEALPHGILFWRSLTHWLGGMGIIVLSLAILPFLGVGGMQLFKAEAPGPVVDKLSPRITETAKILWLVYLGFTVAETILLILGGMSLFDALCHTFGTMATGGFSNYNASAGHFGSAYIDFVIILFMLIAGTNFSLHYHWLKGDFKSLWRSEEFRFYLSLIAGVTLLISIDTYMNVYGDVFETIQYTLFQVVAIVTTTGYGTADYEQWSASSQILLFALMFVGGCAGSTGGGMKVLRIYLLVKFAYSEIVKMIHPQAVVPIRIGSTIVDRKVMINIAGFFVLFALLTVFGSVVMAFLGLDILSALGAVTATINNIGPGLNKVGPTDNYAFIPDAGKWFLSFFMLMGRLELFTVIVLLAPSYWKK